jgi:hypothetical protein
VLRVACSQLPGATKPELRPPAVIKATRTWRLGLNIGPAAPHCVVGAAAFDENCNVKGRTQHN